MTIHHLATRFGRNRHQIGGYEPLDNEALYRHVPSIFAREAHDNQLLALQSQQLADLTAAVAAQGRAQALQSARQAAEEAEGRERFRRFMGN